MENVKIDIFIFQFDSDVEGVKNRYIIVEALCEEYLTRIIGYLVCQVLAVFFAVVNLIFTIPLVLGRACCSKYISFMLVLVNTVLLLIALSLGASVYNEKVCRGASLKYVGFSYGPSFALCVTNFCLGVVTLILYVVRRCMKPVRYMH
ncbi:Amastin surface glycoprotein, putative [Angomonas deanei]|uniref:Amastin surface glycoprotein, putative n=1 Tax=Angomonas deanei TaxID=59799 RepID=A0A7G2CJ01_9TRYP|nr:Amastin surface glycoprotein, putative [Angomonas deanei]